MTPLLASTFGASPWRVTAGSFEGEGLRAYHADSVRTVHLALETPFLSQWAGYATLLPRHRVVLELGPHVALVDLETRRMAILAQGRSPVVVLAK